MLAEVSDAAFILLSLPFFSFCLAAAAAPPPLSWPFQMASIWAGVMVCLSVFMCCPLNMSAMFSVNVHLEDRTCFRDSISAVTWLGRLWMEKWNELAMEALRVTPASDPLLLGLRLVRRLGTMGAGADRTEYVDGFGEAGVIATSTGSCTCSVSVESRLALLGVVSASAALFGCSLCSECWLRRRKSLMDGPGKGENGRRMLRLRLGR
jgi:hypothetical protein